MAKHQTCPISFNILLILEKRATLRFHTSGTAKIVGPDPPNPMVNRYSWHRVGTKGGLGPPVPDRGRPLASNALNVIRLIQQSFMWPVSSKCHSRHFISFISFYSHSNHLILMPFFHFLSFFYFDSHLHHLRLIYLILVSFMSFICGTRGVLLPRPPPLCQLCAKNIGWPLG